MRLSFSHPLLVDEVDMLKVPALLKYDSCGKYLYKYPHCFIVLNLLITWRDTFLIL